MALTFLFYCKAKEEAVPAEEVKAPIPTVNAFCHVEIPTTDFEKAKDFYSGLFNWKVTIMPEMNYASFETGAVPGGGFMKVEEMKPGMTNYILVEDIEATIAKAEELGGKLIHEKEEVPEMGWYALLADPDGNIFGIWKSMERKPEQGT